MKKLLILTLLLCSCSNKSTHEFTKTEFAKIADRLNLIASQMQRKELNNDEAINLIEMQSTAIRVAILTMENK